MNKYAQVIRYFKKISGITVCYCKKSPKPHKPNSLPKGKSAVYVFMFGDICLKVGKAGPKSAARFKWHHYNHKSAKSCLARSIFENKKILISRVDGNIEEGIKKLKKKDMKKWIMTNTSRYDFFIDGEDRIALNLLEAIAQQIYKPIYEGGLSHNEPIR